MTSTHILDFNIIDFVISSPWRCKLVPVQNLDLKLLKTIKLLRTYHSP